MCDNVFMFCQKGSVVKDEERANLSFVVLKSLIGSIGRTMVQFYE